jgi:hypothetical protein
MINRSRIFTPSNRGFSSEKNVTSTRVPVHHKLRIRIVVYTLLCAFAVGFPRQLDECALNGFVYFYFHPS